MKPIIAITLRNADDKGLNALASTDTYHKALTAAGADTLFIGPDHEPEFYNHVADMCQGLLLTGGRDINPAYYHQPLHPQTGLDAACIDEMDFELLRAFSERNKPILGICRGAQDINVYFGGTLYQHLPEIERFTCNHKEKQIPGSGAHHVTWMIELPGLCQKDELLSVNSLHHQGIDAVAPGFAVAAVSEDSLIESIYRDHILAVQWHPERLIEEEKHMKIFQYFIALCRPH